MSLHRRDEKFFNDEQWKIFIEENIKGELTELHITNCSLTDSFIDLLVNELIKNGIFLSVVDLSENYISKNSIQHLCSYLLLDQQVCIQE